MNPKGKTNILVEKMPNEVLVYDLDRHRAHCLNPTAAFLLQMADGSRDVATLAAVTTEAFDTPASEEVIRVGLERLRRAHLMEWEGPEAPKGGMDRRQALRQLATLGLAIPAVMTIVSPLAAQGATTIAIGACALETVGRCCVNSKLCIQNRKKVYKCALPGC